MADKKVIKFQVKLTARKSVIRRTFGHKDDEKVEAGEERQILVLCFVTTANCIPHSIGIVTYNIYACSRCWLEICYIRETVEGLVLFFFLSNDR